MSMMLTYELVSFQRSVRILMLMLPLLLLFHLLSSFLSLSLLPFSPFEVALVHMKCFKNYLIPCMQFLFLYLRNFFSSIHQSIGVQNAHSLFLLSSNAFFISVLPYPWKKTYFRYAISSLILVLFYPSISFPTLSFTLAEVQFFNSSNWK